MNLVCVPMQIFYQRIIAESFSLPYQDLSMSPPPPITVIITLSSSNVFDSTISLVFETTVVVRKFPGVPTSPQVERALEFFDQSDYLMKFVNNAGPAFAL